jgi:peptidoglycan hydrolase-like protein with peptidoglycan-binding domain
VQYTRRFDEDLTCPVMDAVPGRPGPLWRYRHTTQQLGARGAAVRALQRQLHVTVTGNYDLATTTAVVQFQHAHALPVDGRVDSDDWRAMGAFRRTGGHPFLLGRMTTR